MPVAAPFANAIYHVNATAISTISHSKRLITAVYATQPALSTGVYPAGCFYYEMKDINSSAVEVIAEADVRAITGGATM